CVRNTSDCLTNDGVHRSSQGALMAAPFWRNRSTHLCLAVRWYRTDGLEVSGRHSVHCRGWVFVSEPIAGACQSYASTRNVFLFRRCDGYRHLRLDTERGWLRMAAAAWSCDLASRFYDMEALAFKFALDRRHISGSQHAFNRHDPVHDSHKCSLV